MELLTVRQVSQSYGVSARMLRYYEQMGILESRRKDGYAYRVYDRENVQRLQQIILLRKLQIPIKQIKKILINQDAVETLEIFKQNLSELDENITALSVIKSILARFVEDLQEKADIQLKLGIFGNTTLLSIANTLPFSENKIKEKITIDDLDKAEETLSKTNKPKIFTFKARRDAFLFLGFEQVVTRTTNFGTVWDNYFKAAEKAGIEHYEQIIWYCKNGEQVYSVGKIVESTDEIPDGFSLAKFPACEYMVVTHEWLTDVHDGIPLTQNYIGIGQTHDYKENIPMFDGYVRYDDSHSPITQIEIENNVSKDKARFERWMPIKKNEAIV